MASESARGGLLWAVLSLVLPVTFECTTAYRSPALAFSAGVHFATKRCASFSPVLRHYPWSWTAVVIHWSALIWKTLTSRKYPISLNCPPPSHRFSEHHTLRQSRVSYACHNFREQNSPTHNRLEALTSRLHERLQIGNRVSPTDAASQGAVLGVAQRIVLTRTRAPRDSRTTCCFDFLSSKHPDFELEGSARSVVKFEVVLPKAVSYVAYAPVDLDGQIGTMVNAPPEVYVQFVRQSRWRPLA